MSARRLLSSALVVVLLGGCAIAIPPRREPVSEEARAALSLLIERWHQFTDLRALADIVVERDGRRDHLVGVLLAQAPSELRFEVLTPFGVPAFVLAVHEGELTAYDAVNNEARVGTLTAETAADLLSLPVDPDDVVAVLAGRTVPPKDLRVAEIVAPDSSGPSLSLLGRWHRQRVWMDFSSGVVHQLDIVGGRYGVHIVFQRDGQDNMTGLDLEAGNGQVKISVRYQNAAVNGGVDPDRFVLAVPKGAKIRPIR